MVLDWGLVSKTQKSENTLLYHNKHWLIQPKITLVTSPSMGIPLRWSGPPTTSRLYKHEYLEMLAAGGSHSAQRLILHIHLHLAKHKQARFKMWNSWLHTLNRYFSAALLINKKIREGIITRHVLFFVLSKSENQKKWRVTHEPSKISKWTKMASKLATKDLPLLNFGPCSSLGMTRLATCPNFHVALHCPTTCWWKLWWYVVNNIWHDMFFYQIMVCSIMLDDEMFFKRLLIHGSNKNFRVVFVVFHSFNLVQGRWFHSFHTPRCFLEQGTSNPSGGTDTRSRWMGVCGAHHATITWATNPVQTRHTSSQLSKVTAPNSAPWHLWQPSVSLKASIPLKIQRLWAGAKGSQGLLSLDTWCNSHHDHHSWCFLRNQGTVRWQTWGQPCQGLRGPMNLLKWNAFAVKCNGTSPRWSCLSWMLLLSIWAPSHGQLQVNEAGDEYREPHLAYHQQGVKGRW